MLSSFKAFSKKHVPGQLVIQLTDRCNALCPQCGMRVSEPFKRSTLPVEDIKRTIDAASANGVQALSFTGGEPLLYLDDLVTLIQYAGKAGIPYIRTGTNGYLFRKQKSIRHYFDQVSQIADKLSNTPLRNFWISIDSAIPAVHDYMRGFQGLMCGIEGALPIFHRYGLYPSANLGINRNMLGERTASIYCDDNQEERTKEDHFYAQFRKAFQLFYAQVCNMGFTIVNTCYPMSVEAQANTQLEAVYAATASSRVVHFSRVEKRLLFKALFNTIPEFRSRIRIFSPRTSLYALIKQYSKSEEHSFACRGGIDYFFIDARDGNTYPCGYRGKDNYGKYWNIDWKMIDRHAQCYACDWECFRDPSEILGPVFEGLSNPVGLFQKWRNDSVFFKLWLRDLKYYRACDLFDGRKPTQYEKLALFAKKTSKQKAFLL